MKRSTLILAACGIFALLVLGLAPFVGPRWISPSLLLADPALQPDARILWSIRLPRVLLAFCAGAGLALGGAVFQALFRNPLATPFTLGVSSGAACGASCYLLSGLSLSLLGIPGLTLSALAGAGVSILLVHGLGRACRSLGPNGLLLAGVAVSFTFSSLILFTQYLADFSQSYRILRWLMGGLDLVGRGPLLGLLPLLLPGAVIVLLLARPLDLLSTGDELARSRGLSTGRARGALFFASSLVVGAVVAQCGPVAFVGMMVPHICRLLTGPRHGALLPLCLLFGGAFLVLCDTAARSLMAPAEIPVGVLTALLGGPFFLWLLLSRRGATP